MINGRLQANWAIYAACCLAMFSAGCATHAGTGAAAGAGFGGTMGALIGSQSGHAGGGALLGAMTGAVVGGLAGEAEDAREQRDVAIAQAQYERNMAARSSVTNYDLITMAQAGLSDQVIINAVQTRGGQFDLSPSAIIELKSRGLSENVILAIQRSSEGGITRASSVISRPVTTVVTTPPSVYIVRPAVTPSVGLYFGPRRPSYGYRSRWHHHHHHHW